MGWAEFKRPTSDWRILKSMTGICVPWALITPGPLLFRAHLVPCDVNVVLQLRCMYESKRVISNPSHVMHVLACQVFDQPMRE